MLPLLYSPLGFASQPQERSLTYTEIDELLQSIPAFEPPTCNPPPPPPASWLLAASGSCGALEVSELNGSRAIAFSFNTSRLMGFTDAPFHSAGEIASTDEAQQLSARKWNHKNIALMVPSGEEWASAVFQVGTHAACGSHCVSYTGSLTNVTSNFDASSYATGRTLCQLFVDSATSLNIIGWYYQVKGLGEEQSRYDDLGDRLQDAARMSHRLTVIRPEKIP